MATKPAPSIIACIDPYKFDQRFLEKLKECKTQKRAYRKMEKEYRQVFGHRRYANFKSYYSARRRRIKNALHASNHR